MSARAAAKIADTPVEVEAEDISQENPDSDSDMVQEKRKSNSAIIREAVDEGYDSPKDGCAWILETYKRKITPQNYSQIKAQYKKKTSNDGASDDKQSRSVPTTSTAATPKIPQLPNTFGEDMKEINLLIQSQGGPAKLKDLLGQIKGLIGRYGTQNLEAMIDAFSV
ncbi:hypothetical protein TA3x_004247 [Tundrisphaera sp. TA3]|uniref:hypothetical protein n=1 Tax=Tundrisphaera sp. TA3 TaxID=3435775 RepID=UPI003EBC08EF